MIDKGFILAAGIGSRLRPHTDTLPKPMVCVAGKPIIGHALDALVASGVRQVVVNLHHLPNVLESYLATRTGPDIVLSHEDSLLDTGGGVKKMLHVFDAEDGFFILNGDAFWTDGPSIPTLSRLSAAWNSHAMDILLLLQPVSTMILTGGVGDYDVLPDGRTLRNKGRNGTHMFAGIRIAHPRIFKDSPDGAFSFLRLMDLAEESGRLYALVHDGAWHHISTADDLSRVNDFVTGKGPA